MYVNKDTGQNVSLAELAEQLNCSIPENPDAAAQDALGVTELVQTPAPSPAHRQGRNALVEGEWTTTWLEPDTAALKSTALAAINYECESRLRKLRDSYPDSEVISWDKQEAEARAGASPFIASLAQVRGIALADMIERIIAKADAYAVISAQIIGKRQVLEAQINAGDTNVMWL